MGLRRCILPTRSTMPSATPRAQAASTLPPTYLIVVLSFSSPLISAPVTFFSISRKYCSDKPVKLVTRVLPTSDSGVCKSPFSGTWTCSLQRPNSKSISSTIPEVSVGGVTASCSATTSRPVMPRSTLPSPTNVGMSEAGRKTRARGRFLTRAMSRRLWRWNWMSEPESSSMHA